MRMLPGDRIRPMGDGFPKLVLHCMICVTTEENSFPLKRVFKTESTLDTINCQEIKLLSEP